VPAAPDYAPSLAASGRRRPPQRATPKNSRLGFFGTPSGRTLAKRHSARRTAPGYRACGYKTASGRPKWLNRDPIGEAGGLNLYGYVGNNPIDVVDPLGLWQITIGGGWGIAGEISFGYNSGRANISGTIGVGGGLAGSFNPNDSGPSGMQGPSTTEGLIAKGDLDLGFVSLNGEAGVTTESDGCHHFHDKAYLQGGANLNAVEPGYPPFGGVSGEIGVQQSGTDNGGISSRGTYAQSNGINYSAGALVLAGAKVGVSW
jgi:RHS repeat-associated protein